MLISGLHPVRSDNAPVRMMISMLYFRTEASGGRKRRRSAYTLAEVLVAVVVLAVVAGAFYGALSSAFSVVQSTREDLRATQILMQELEAIRLCTWSQLTNFSFREPYDPMHGTNDAAGVTYSGTVNVGQATNVPSTVSYANDIRLITVSLNWTNYKGNVAIPHIRQMQTQVARNGLQNYVWGAVQ